MTKREPKAGRVVDARPQDGSPEDPAPSEAEAEGADPSELDADIGEQSTDDPDADIDEQSTGELDADIGEQSTDEVDDDESLEEAAEVVEADLAQLVDERDEYLDQLRRVQAEFENYRKRVLKQQTENFERASEGLVSDLLPVLDACDAALQHGDGGIEPVAKALMDVLEKQGLERHDPEGEPFDPNLHEAVAHEPGEGESLVSEVLRAGYSWKGRVLRPAMVRVRG